MVCDMLPSDALCGGLEAQMKGSYLDQFVAVKMGNKLRNILEGINALSHQCISGESWYVT